MTPTHSIPFAIPFICKEEEDAVLSVLRSGWLTTAGEALSFEKEFAAFLQAPAASQLTALAVNSATAGLHLALESCGVKAGDVVIVPSYTFASDAEVVRYLDAEVAFVDCGSGGESPPRSTPASGCSATPPSGALPPNPCFNLSTAGLQSTLSRLASGKTAYEWGGPKGRPAAVIAVHYGGLVCDIDAVVETAHRYGAAVIEDSAHAFPAKTPDGRWAGTIGDVGIFSFYATKTITTGEGGMFVTCNPDIAKRAALMRLHGIDRPIWNRYNAQGLDTRAAPQAPHWYYEISAPGYKYNLCDILAAIGRVQLKRATSLLEMRQKIAAHYDKAFRDIDSFILPPTDSGDARHLYPLRIRADKLPARNEIIERLKEKGIGTSVHFIPLHIMPYYKTRYNLKDNSFPKAFSNFCNEISLPIFPSLTEDQSERIILSLKEVCGVC